jgi:hypothetical protein
MFGKHCRCLHPICLPSALYRIDEDQDIGSTAWTIRCPLMAAIANARLPAHPQAT